MKRTQTCITLALLFLLTVPLAAAGIAGKWQFSFDTPVGTRKSEMAISVDGENVTAKSAKDEFKGTFRDGRLVLAATVHSAEGDITDELKINGHLEGEKITGEATFSSYTMSFTAERIKE